MAWSKIAPLHIGQGERGEDIVLNHDVSIV